LEECHTEFGRASLPGGVRDVKLSKMPFLTSPLICTHRFH
jgi:hypothetical protein